MVRRRASPVRQVLGPPLTSCAILGELLNPFAPQFSHLHNGHTSRVAEINNRQSVERAWCRALCAVRAP